MSQYVVEKILKNTNNSKDILQEVPNGIFVDKFTKDYSKEKTMNKYSQIGEITNQIKFRNNERNEINKYWDMNNKLLNISINNSDKTRDNIFKNLDDTRDKLLTNSSIRKLKTSTSQTNRIFPIDNKQNSNYKGMNVGIPKIPRDLSKIQIKKNIIGAENETRDLGRSRSTIKGRNIFNIPK